MAKPPSDNESNGPGKRLRVSQDPSETEGKKRVRLRPIPLSEIPWGTSSPVDLYKRAEQELSLLFRSGSSLTPEAYSDVSPSSDKLYYDKDAQVNWQSLVDSNLTEILKTSLTPEAKAAIAYKSAGRTTQKIFQDFNQEAYEEASVIVDAFHGLMEEPGTMESFFQLTIHDYYTYTHSMHVFLYSSMLTREIIGEMNESIKNKIGIGYLLHDIGKKDISTEILNKKGKLDDGEWDIIKAHPQTGYHLLKEVVGDISEEVGEIVLQHHEKLDGTGYPNNLKMEEIGRFGRICAIGDVFDALTTRRSYKEALSKMTALTIMRDEKGHLDEKLLERFIRLAVNCIE